METLNADMEQLAREDFKAGLVNGKIPRDSDGNVLINMSDPIPGSSLDFIYTEYPDRIDDAERAYIAELRHLIS